MIGSLITIMWQFMQVRAENKRLKGGGRSAGREAPPRKSAYSARIDDELEYAPTKRGNRRNEDRFDRSNNEREDPEELPSRRSATRQLPENRFAQTAPRRRLTGPARTEVSSLARRQNDSWDREDDWNETDWNESDDAVQARRALPDADLASKQPERRATRRRSERPDAAESTRRDLAATTDDTEAPPRRRPRNTADDSGERRSKRDRTGTQEGTTANYVDYEPIDPPSGLPPSGSEPIVFPDRY
jgi:hypothetical protein